MKNNLKIITIVVSIANMLVLMIIIDKIIKKSELPILMIFFWIICLFLNLYYLLKLKKSKTSNK